jgi:HAD superfamily hydrolase (TIGR01456 family)
MRKAIGVVLDVDGVFVKGSHLIPQAKSALKILANANIQRVFLTNGGGITEDEKAKELSDKLEERISPNELILSHTPFKRLVSSYADKKVLVIGGKRCVRVAKSYGFRRALTSQMLHQQNPDIYPLKRPLLHSELVKEENKDEVSAVLIFGDSTDWGLDMQVLTDLLLNENHQPCPQRINLPIHACNADLIFNGTHELPRFTQGAFVHSFMNLFKHYSNQPIQINYCGKPYKIQYEYAEEMFKRNSSLNSLPAPVRFYAIGDNPRSDVRGARGAGSHWRSILVRTGVFTGSGNDTTDPADYVEDNVYDAVMRIFREEGLEH